MRHIEIASDKFASIARTLYILRHIDELEYIYRQGQHDFTARISEE